MFVVFGKPITSVNSAGSSDLGDVQSSSDCAEYGSRKGINGVEVYIHSGNRGDKGKNQDTPQETPGPAQPAQAVTETKLPQSAARGSSGDGTSLNAAWDGQP
ncbi:uncharacterized protein ATNIH1004_005263 [Aspergillus tanneri]|uniref:Uncharacterized protein n=1 Tax=Aspergillus tanneri TaxID=1220188 RepID=A0A5M9MQH4_9EURO|nr:uncharacterized protein ATNIH1004_005263 [Aspergillus tanneri]KAA8649362.1 hypothetical protein ATNIH1004_005263 [Aspergillus tanneri]